MRKIMIAGAKSGVGKTTISSAIMSAFDNVAPFKVGPDYIDPKFHEFVTGNNSYNLDAYMLDKTSLEYCFYEGSRGKNISIVEGVMGLYDGLGHQKENFSSAHVSKILDIPVILVVDAKGISTSIAAEVLGFKIFDTEVNIKGVILNNVSSEKLYLMLKEAIEMYTGIECVGYFPKNAELSVESRHLGLVQASELEDIEKRIERLKIAAKEFIDLDRIYEIADCGEHKEIIDPAERLIGSLKGKRIAVAKDEAFTFYYQLNLDLLEKSGAEIIEFSPINDEKLPDNIDFIYIGGGYPEIYAEELSGNKSMIESIREAFEQKISIYAECGGFIFLTKGIKKLDGNFVEMCGLLNIKVEMKNRLNIKRFGYIEIGTKDEFYLDETSCELNKKLKIKAHEFYCDEMSCGPNKKLKIKAHEFHYSDIYDVNEDKTEFKVSKYDGRNWKCGYRKGSILAGYPHINFYSNLEFFERLFGI